MWPSTESDSTKFDVKSIIIFAGAFTLSVVFCVIASLVYGNYLPFVSMVFFFISPLPYFTCAKHRSQSTGVWNTSDDDDEPGINHMGQFLASSISLIGLALPWLLYHNDKLTLGSAILTFIGGVLLYGVLIIIEYLRARKSASM
jgi:hypothetical protein